MTQTMIEVEAVSKRFGKTQALATMDLIADQGRVLALLGPNGAGKTTLVRILTTLLRPDSGSARVAGYGVMPRGQGSFVGVTSSAKLDDCVVRLVSPASTRPSMSC